MLCAHRCLSPEATFCVASRFVHLLARLRFVTGTEQMVTFRHNRFCDIGVGPVIAVLAWYSDHGGYGTGVATQYQQHRRCRLCRLQLPASRQAVHPQYRLVLAGLSPPSAKEWNLQCSRASCLTYTTVSFLPSFELLGCVCSIPLLRNAARNEFLMVEHHNCMHIRMLLGLCPYSHEMELMFRAICTP